MKGTTLKLEQGGENMKKVLSLALVVLTVFSVVSVTATALDVEPRWNNTNSAISSLYINSSGRASVAFNCVGFTGTTSIKAETKLERKWGIFWLDVDGGEWTDTTNDNFISLTHYLQLSKTGTYRATTNFTVSGTGGSADEIECRSEYVYE